MVTNAQALDPDVEEYFRRAERHSDRKGAVRREAFKRLLELARENDPTGKLLLAEKTRDYFPDFPDYQEEAINALYDMCEDQNRQVRLAGYISLTAVSKSMINIDKAWAQQNADVLLQLLQTDDEEEIFTVKRALQEHIDLDPLGTIRILSSQCVFERHGLDEEELGARERIQTHILRFFDEKSRSCIARVAENAEVEKELLTALKSAMTSCPTSELELIFKRIIPSLPSIVNGRGNVSSEMLQKLLLRAAEHLKSGDGEAARCALAVAANFVSVTPSPSLSLQRSKSGKIPATGTAVAVDPSLYIRFHGSSVLFNNVSLSARVAIVDLVCKVYESAVSRKGAPLVSIMNAFLEVAPSLYNMLVVNMFEKQSDFDFMPRLKILTLIHKMTSTAPDLAIFTQELRDLLRNLASNTGKTPNGQESAEDIDMPHASTVNGNADQLQTLSREILKKIDREPHTLANRNQVLHSKAGSPASALRSAPSTNIASSSSSQLTPAGVSSEKELVIRGNASKRHREEDKDMDVDIEVSNSSSQRKSRKRIFVSSSVNATDPTPSSRSSLLSRIGTDSSRSTTPGLDSQPLNKTETSPSGMDSGLSLLARLSNDPTQVSSKHSALQGGRIKRPSGSYPSQLTNAPIARDSMATIHPPLNANEGEISIRGAANRANDEQQRPSTLFERLTFDTKPNTEGTSRRRRRG